MQKGEVQLGLIFHLDQRNHEVRRFDEPIHIVFHVQRKEGVIREGLFPRKQYVPTDICLIDNIKVGQYVFKLEAPN